MVHLIISRGEPLGLRVFLGYKNDMVVILGFVEMIKDSLDKFKEKSTSNNVLYIRM